MSTAKPAPVRLQATKLNGALHQTWQGEFVGQAGEWLVVRTPIGTPVRHHTNDLTYVLAHDNLGIFSTEKYWNIFIDFNPIKPNNASGSFKQLYINVAMPATWDRTQSVVSWVDLELDVVVRPKAKPELWDVDEFDAAKHNGDLPLDLANRAEAVARHLMVEAGRNKFPFLTSSYDKTLRQIMDVLKTRS